EMTRRHGRSTHRPLQFWLNVEFWRLLTGRPGAWSGFVTEIPRFPWSRSQRILILWINWFERSRAASLPPRKPSEWRISWVGRLVALSFPRLPRQSRPLGLPSRPLGPPRQSRLPRQSRPLGPLGLPRHPKLLRKPGLGH